MQIENNSGNYDLHVISFTHWDREWYYSFETFRQILVHLIDHVIDTLETNPAFRAFHLDGQTAQILDYLQIKPQNKKRIINLIKQNRIIIGPAYIQSDEFMASGETQIRNILLGQLDCEEIKVKPMNVGFILDQFGHTSQTPQIYSGFGIDRLLLARGIKNVDGKITFNWKSPDGSKCLTNFLPQWYNNFQRMPAKVVDADNLIRNITDFQKDKIIGKTVVMMNGVDHIDIQRELPSLIHNYEASNPGHNLIHSTADEMFDALESEMKAMQKKPEIEGELRVGEELELLSGTLSARIYLKQKNFDLASLIEHYLEPLCSLADINSPGFYPYDSLKYMWRNYVLNQPHDSICGCSIDEVHFQMMARFHQVNDVCRFNMKLAGEKIANQIKFDPEKNPDAEQIIMFWNPTAHEEERAMEITIELPCFMNKCSWIDPVIYPVDQPDKPLKNQVISIDKVIRIHTHLLRLPHGVDVYQYKMLVTLPPVPSIGYKAFCIKRGRDLGQIVIEHKEIHNEEPLMENENLCVKIHQDGSFDITDKLTGKVFENLHYLEDSGDTGHEYIFVPPANNTILTTLSRDAEITRIENNEFRQKYKIVWEIDIPEGVDFLSDSRKPFTINHRFESILTLRKGSCCLEIQTRFINNAKNHRVRAIFKTPFSSAECRVFNAFDVVKHEIPPNHKEGCGGDPNYGFADVTGSDKGLTVFTPGLHESFYEKDNNELQITLMRAVGSLGQDPRPELKEAIVDYKTYDSQCIGENIVNYAVYVHSPETPVEIIKKESELFINPPEYYISYPDYGQIISGTRREEMAHGYFDPSAEQMFPDERTLPAENALVKISNPTIVFSAFKRSEREDDKYIFRVFNITDKKQEAEITFVRNPTEIFTADLNEKKKKKIASVGNKVKVKIPPKKIGTFVIGF